MDPVKAPGIVVNLWSSVLVSHTASKFKKAITMRLKENAMSWFTRKGIKGACSAFFKHFALNQPQHSFKLAII